MESRDESAEVGASPSWEADAIFERDFAHLEGRHYLDHAGAAPVPASLARQAAADLLGCGNPHSANGPGEAARGRIAEARRLAAEVLLGKFADRYACVFTSGATASLKLVADCFPWREGSSFACVADSHDSAWGMGEVARSHGGAVSEIALDTATLSESKRRQAKGDGAAPNLFTFPGENNVTGAKHDVRRWVEHAKRGHLGAGGGDWYVCLDASKLLAGSPLELHEDGLPDFIALSFYKLVGAPTGLGALFVKSDCLPLLARSKVYRGGGAAAAFAAMDSRGVELEDASPGAGVRLLEDGTLPFQQIALLLRGLRWLGGLGPAAAREMHAWRLRDLLVRRLAGLRHPATGGAICALYGPPAGTPASEVGGVVAFNVLDQKGRVVSHATVGHAAAARGIDLRWGAFCNVGALRQALLVVHGDAVELTDPCWQPPEALAADGYVNGAVRASLGLASREVDVAALADFVADFAASLPCEDAASAEAAQAVAETLDSQSTVASEDSQQLPAKLLKYRRWQEVKSVRDSLPLLRPPRKHSTPGAPRERLPQICGNAKERAHAGRAFPNPLAAMRGDSIPGMCWFLHDMRHKYSVDDEYPQITFGRDWQARTLLMQAASRGFTDVCEVLIKVFHADVNRRSSSDGDTALHRAACTGRPDICRMLLHAGARVDLEVLGGPLAGWRASRVADWKAREDRDAHEMAPHANYAPLRGGSFHEVVALLRAEERVVDAAADAAALVAALAVAAAAALLGAPRAMATTVVVDDCAMSALAAPPVGVAGGAEVGLALARGA